MEKNSTFQHNIQRNEEEETRGREAPNFRSLDDQCGKEKWADVLIFLASHGNWDLADEFPLPWKSGGQRLYRCDVGAPGVETRLPRLCAAINCHSCFGLARSWMVAGAGGGGRLR